MKIAFSKKKLVVYFDSILVFLRGINLNEKFANLRCMKYLANAKSLKSATLARREKTVTGDRKRVRMLVSYLLGVKISDLVLVTMSQTKVDYHRPN